MIRLCFFRIFATYYLFEFRKLNLRNNNYIYSPAAKAGLLIRPLMISISSMQHSRMRQNTKPIITL